MLVGSLLQGNALSAAADNAAEFVSLAIQATRPTRKHGAAYGSSRCCPGYAPCSTGRCWNEQTDLEYCFGRAPYPQNTGNVARTCACTACRLHLVGPWALPLMIKTEARRAGLLALPGHPLLCDSLDDFCQNNGPYFYFTTKRCTATPMYNTRTAPI